MNQVKITASQTLLKRYTLAVLLASLVINLLSAYIRHVEAGLDCQPWPECYAIIGKMVVAEDSANIAQKALAPTEIAKKMHRSIAIVLVIAVLLLLHQSRIPTVMKGVNTSLPYLLLAVILLLSIIGPASYLKTMPIIAVLNLVGGLALLAICWWLFLQLSPSIGAKFVIDPPSWIKKLWLVALAALALQIISGGWVSANFAADACSGLLSCNEFAQNNSLKSDSFWYFRELNLSSAGKVLFDSNTVTIHLAHRFAAICSGSVLLLCAFLLFKYCRMLAILTMLLLLIQVTIGAISVLFDLPLILVMAHNFNATILLMTVMAVIFKLNPNSN